MTKTKSEIILYAPRRSGHHAIIDSYCHASPIPVVFVNDQDPATSPFHANKLPHTRLRYKTLIHSRLQGPAFRLLKHIPISTTLVHNYEDYTNPNSEPTTNSISPSARHVVVLRDPYNLLSSRLKWHRTVHARFETLSDTDFVNRLHTAVSILTQLIDMSEQHSLPIFKYDDWLQEPDGPERYAAMLGINKRLEWPSAVAKFGPGSSFQGQTSEHAKQLDVFGRWKIFRDDPVYREVALTQRVAEITEKYFPNSPGLEWAQNERHA